MRLRSEECSKASTFLYGNYIAFLLTWMIEQKTYYAFIAAGMLILSWITHYMGIYKKNTGE